MEIDVSKCPHYEGGICYNEGVLYKYCEQCPDCMPKQFQQLKAENEELKKYIDRAGIIGIIKVLKCLDEIEKYCNNAMDFSIYGDALGIVAKNILQKIKEVKGE